MQVTVSLVAFIFVLDAILAVYIVYYIKTNPKKRETRELIDRELQIYKAKYEAERTKQFARIAGEMTREKISKIAEQSCQIKKK